MINNIESISTSSQEVSSLSELATSQTEVGNDNLKDAIKQIKEINESINRSVELIHRLDKNSKLIKETQYNSEASLDSIINISKKAELGNQMIEKAGESFSQIQNSIKQTSLFVQGTAISAEELAENSDNVNDSINDIQSMSQNINNSSHQLSNMAQHLTELMEQFKI